MNFIATRIARNIWAAMIWFMRRPWMRRLQRNSIKIVPEGRMRDKAWDNYRRREKFARRHGLGILTGVVSLFLYGFAFVCVYSFLSRAIELGWIPSKDSELSK